VAFQLAYPEGSVLISALTIAIAEYRSRLANPDVAIWHAETRAQLAMAENMLARLIGEPADVKDLSPQS